jgi:hypothetical protein
VACSLSIANVNAVLAATPGLHGRRNRYTPQQIGSLVSAHAKLGGSLGATVRNINQVGGFGAVSASMVHRWAQKEEDNPPPRKRGVKAQVDFEKEVINELIYTSVAEVDSPTEACVVANVAYSYWIVTAAARKVQALASWADDAKVQGLMFSHKWIRMFLQRAAIYKRKVTTNDKPKAPEAEVKQIMQNIQDFIKLKEFSAGQVWSVDEVGCLYGVAPDHVSTPRDAERASGPASDNRSRFTFMLGGNAAGVMMPAFGIGKCGTNVVADMSRTRVVHNLQKNDEFFKGWELKWWERTLNLRGKKKDEYVEKKYTRPYLISPSGAVVTIQHKAWMDTVGLCMYMDLVAEPTMKKENGGPVIWDSCGPHGTAAAKAVAAEWNMDEMKLPVNMTGVCCRVALTACHMPHAC